MALKNWEDIRIALSSRFNQTWKLGNWLNCLVTVADPEFAPELPLPGRAWLCFRGSLGGGGGVVGGRVCRVVVGRVVRRVVVGRVVRRVVGGRVGFGGGGGGLVGGGVGRVVRRVGGGGGRVVRRVGGGGGGRVGAGTLGRNGSVTPCLPSPSILWMKEMMINPMIRRGRRWKWMMTG